MTSSIEVTPENFVCAVQTLYHDQDATRKKIASEWLLSVQSSLYAWTLADQLIRMNQNSEVTCLSAQILRHKIQHSFDELPVEHCKALCDSLLDHLSRAELTRHSTVRVQLAVATADLALQYVGWEKPVEDVVEKLKTSSEHMLTLLEFLTALPEEVNTSTIRIGENRRRFCREKYSNGGKQIHEILIFLLKVNPSHNEALFIGILKCFASWISIKAFDETLLLSSPFLHSILDILKSPQCSNELHKSACDCLCNILELCEEYQKYWSLAVHLKQQITQHLSQPYFQAVKDENLDKAQNYTRIYTNLIESILECLVDGRQSDLSDLSCLNLLLYPLEHSDYEIVQSTFYTWYSLSDLIQTHNDEMADKIKPYMEKLVDMLCVQCKLDSDHLGIPPETDEKNSKNNRTSNSDLADFRYRVECLIKDTISITGASNCFQRMFEKLQLSTSLSWEESEAPLYIMSCVASYLSPDEDKIVPNVIQAIISTPTQPGLVHSALKYTGVRLISQLDQWIAENNQHILKSVLQYLLSLLVDKELRFVSADAILNICQQCRKQLVNDLDQIIQATLWLDQIEAGSEASQCLLKASSKLISRIVSTDDIHRYLKLLFDQQIQSLTQIVSTQSDSNYTSIIKRLDCLTAIFRSLDFKITHEETHPCTTIVQQLLPLLDLIIVRYRSSTKLSECWSRTIRFIIRSMRSHAKLFFQQIVTLVISSYDEVSHSCFLYLISIIIDEYGNDQDLKAAIIVMSEHLTNKTFSILTHQDGFKQNPDLVDDFYRLSSRLLQRCPLEFLKSNIIRPIIEQIIPNCNLEHRDASASMIAFLQALAKLTSNHKKDSKYKSELSEIRSLSMSLCETYFESVLTGLIRAIVIDRVPSSIRVSVSEFVCDLKTYMPDKFSQWLRKSLTEIPRTSKNGLVEIVTIKQHEQFYNALCENDIQSSTIDYEFETFAKLYR
ncbi:unnamed protein product [Adineta steineri]|uniref:Exportin-1/Importin-beta-like domain-containing protein n=1 Tax=Adineta steineri TaxID=433720 RepID=A0A816DBD1_9BILA|nr:unnamed protein product [Adineta steineri]CAF1634088.1 unnamed protein product [Adineta steineri]